MSKKTIALIIILLLITVGLLYLALAPKTQNVSLAPPAPTTVPSPTPVAQTVLSFSPNSLIVASQSGSLDLTIDTGENSVTAVQVELAFDPGALSDIAITDGTFFKQASSLLKNIDAKNGKISYILAIPPEGLPQKGKGSVATISFTTKLVSGRKTEVTFLPKTLVTANNVAVSVLRSTSNASIFYLKQNQNATSSATEDKMTGPLKPTTP